MGWTNYCKSSTRRNCSKAANWLISVCDVKKGFKLYPRMVIAKVMQVASNLLWLLSYIVSSLSVVGL